ncbi:transcriptional regulatory protein [Mycobacteroides abscessus subsp. abscessus]|uniref:Transcriptional regulator n=1 Tax=Mycobacteroides abscessus subsp. abscessus TaxID=1185650 RepID=A0AB38D0E0_9MYCO|nr:helix-turn-helix domain-containing protein [Mycobacteroides abscessus]SHX06661.1 transcriptional regulatory protein [Mycobacteroides abscessus subsp. abscessus]SIA11411.1 transcriptional regulator [Mycobacteroides abscessus subsp. abscessus]SIB13866.1 transcriptional regulator [Mycobacteroides abscessus subsp. abscessus]SIB14827.1 transcriptional regulator [Mycobacteroides abscessus subsp. abscessus]SIB17689.1 transcriptional regulator [Mycobacteroides abscessus subsp. abscessus]
MKTHGDERARERAALKAEYEAGASIRALATAGGHSYGYVRDALTQSGTQLRGRGGANNRNPIPIAPEKAYRRQRAAQPTPEQ